LESLRFANRFEYEIIIEDDIDVSALKVPPLIIQPYAENAIWHGLMHKAVAGHLQIKLYQEEEILFCKITDNGIGRGKAGELKSKSSLTHKSLGIRITADRIAMLQQDQQKNNFITITDLVLPDNSAGGTEVLIKIHPYYD
jgi:sensor histidine kinase YesM